MLLFDNITSPSRSKVVFRFFSLSQNVYASVPGASSFDDLVKAASGIGGVQGRGCWSGTSAQAGGGVPAPSPYGYELFLAFHIKSTGSIA